MDPVPIMIVDDEWSIRRVLGTALARAGYAVSEADSARAALDLIPKWGPVAVLLDLELPDCEGLELVQLIRQATTAAIIIVSARNAVETKIGAFANGAQDYIVKPFDLDEVLARVRSALRRRVVDIGTTSVVKAGDVEIDVSARQVRKAGQILHLARKEYEVLATLAASPGRVVTHNTILNRVWPSHKVHHVEYLHVVVRNLRLKIETDPAAPSIILNELRVGYRLNITA